MQFKNGIFRRTPAETPDSWRMENGGRWDLVHDHDGDFYYQETFVVDARQASLVFHTGPGGRLMDQVPAEFIKVFGIRPVGDMAEITRWESELALWGGADTLLDIPEADRAYAQEFYRAWGMGEPFSYRLTNGTRITVFPQSREPRYQFPTKLIYDFTVGGADYMVAVYQVVAYFQRNEKPPQLARVLDRAGGHTG